MWLKQTQSIDPSCIPELVDGKVYFRKPQVTWRAKHKGFHGFPVEFPHDLGANPVTIRSFGLAKHWSFGGENLRKPRALRPALSCAAETLGGFNDGS